MLSLTCRRSIAMTANKKQVENEKFSLQKLKMLCHSRRAMEYLSPKEQRRMINMRKFSGKYSRV